MTACIATELQARLDTLGRGAPDHASQIVQTILDEAAVRTASDVHFEPTASDVSIRYRLDGVLQQVGSLDRSLAPNLVARLKVLAELLTYRTDIPQEGRIRDLNGNGRQVEMRVSTFPTIHGEKVVVRLFTTGSDCRELEQLGLPDEIQANLERLLNERTGAVLLTGPSGSGKTTTIYACLRRILRTSSGGRHIVTIEDPVEQVIEGISQSQARPGTDFDFARGLRSLLRQDPEVIMIGEVRDRETAAITVEAALTGHLVFSTLHAGSACGVISRLLEMGIEPYLLTSSIKAILNQRLVRRACKSCRAATNGHEATCLVCGGVGYRGRVLLAELLTITAPLRDAILARRDTAALEAVADQSGRSSLRAAAASAVRAGLTTDAEIVRVLGPV